MITRTILASVFVFAIACGGAQTAILEPDLEPTPTIENGKKLLEEGRIEEASSMFEKIIADDPNSAEGHRYLAFSYRNLGKIEDAIKHYQRAIEIEPDHADTINSLGVLLLDQGDIQGAEASLSRYLELKPDDAFANYNYALLLEAKGKRKQARKYYEKSAELDPSDPAAWMALADMDREDGNLKKAMAKCDKGLETSPDSPELALKKGHILIELNRHDDGEAVLLGLKDIAECPPDMMATAGLLLAKLKKDDSALTLYLAAIEADKTYATAHFLAANVLARKGRFAEAAVHFEAVIENSPNTKESEIAEQGLAACKKNMKAEP